MFRCSRFLSEILHVPSPKDEWLHSTQQSLQMICNHRLDLESTLDDIWHDLKKQQPRMVRSFVQDDLGGRSWLGALILQLIGCCSLLCIAFPS